MNEDKLNEEVRLWALLAVGALALAGVALFLALARTPFVQDLVPTGFFQMALVVHVVFSFVVWYLGVLALASAWATSGLAEDGVAIRWGVLGPLGLRGMVASFFLLLVPLVMGWGEPSLNNYVPVVGHPVFYAGLALLFLSVAMPVVRLLVNLPRPAEAASYGVAAAGVTYLIALVCFLLAWVNLPPGLSLVPRNEFLFWGGGHVLQFVNTALMLVAWQVVAERFHLVPPVPGPLFRAMLALIATAALAGPAFYFLFDADDALLVLSFTWLYWFGLIVQPAVVMIALAVALVRRGFHLGTPGGLAVTLSLLLFAAGGVMGYLVGEGDLRTPAHYHAVINATTLAFIAFFVAAVLPRLGRPVERPRWVLALVLLFGVGQLLQSGGWFIAGLLGVARKTAGAAQGLDTALKQVTMIVANTGGGLATIGGIIFIVLMLRKLLGPPSTPSR